MFVPGLILMRFLFMRFTRWRTFERVGVEL